MRAVKKNPVTSLVNSFFIDSPLPSNITYFWNFGSLLGATLILQIVSGIFLAMHYVPNTGLAFSSVEHIMRDVNYGYLVRYAHANGASMFFILIYLHIARGLYFGSYTRPRLMLWSVGVIILILLVVIAFLGYVKDKISPKGFKKEKSVFNSVERYLLIIVNFCLIFAKTCVEIKENKSVGRHRADDPFNRILGGTSRISSISININLFSTCKRGYATLSSEPRKTNHPLSPEVESFLKEKNLKAYSVYESLTEESTKKALKKDSDNKSGIYLILNKISGDYYIGSASTAKFYSRFSNHLIHGIGSKVVKAAVHKYGLSAFTFIILVIYNPAGGGPVNRLTNRGLLDLEDFYLKTLLPNYNILTEAGNSFGYRHTNITRIKMVTFYSDERRNQIGSLNLDKNLSLKVRKKLSLAKLGKPLQFSEKGYAALCKKVKITNLDSTVWGLFESITAAAKSLNCDRKTIRIAIQKNTTLLKKYKAYYI